MDYHIEEMTTQSPSMQEIRKGLWFSVFVNNTFYRVFTSNYYGDNMAIYDQENNVVRDEQAVLDVSEALLTWLGSHAYEN
jgi:hypothetical protein